MILTKNIEKNCSNCANIFNLLSQKIIYLKSKKEINIYKNQCDNNIFMLKTNNTDNTNIDNCVKVKICSDDLLEIYDVDLKLIDKIDKNNKEILFYEEILKKKIIQVSPGGLYGFYDAGICSIIKKNYNLDDSIFLGASAGAWNSLFLSYKKDINELITSIFDIDLTISSIKNLQIKLKEKILESHKTEEFDLKNLYISVCVLDNYRFKNYIYTDFENLEDAINCCIASSNIPFLTGNLIHRYRGKISLDGGFLVNKSILFKKPFYTINYSIWGKKRLFTSLFDKKNTNIKHLYEEGIKDTINNIDFLDNKFIDV